MPLTDLSNTKWIFNASPSTYPETSTMYNLNFSASNGNTYTGIRFNPLVGIYFGSTQVYDVSAGEWIDNAFTGEWIDEAYRTIEISGGTEATSTDLIALMQANAVQQMPDISVVYKGSTIAKMSSSGTKTLLTSGKYCEDNITIEYTKTIYNGAHHQPTPSGYTVTVSLTNPSHTSVFGSCYIYEALSDDPYDTAQSIAEITSPTGTATISVPTSAYGICVVIRGGHGSSPGGGTASATGNVSFSSGDISTGFVFQVTGDGTANIDGIDYVYIDVS